MLQWKRLRILLLGAGVALLVWVTALPAQQPARSAANSGRIDATVLKNAGTATDGNQLVRSERMRTG